MQKKRLNKFVRDHLLPGIPFVLLLVSGGLLLFSRFWNMDQLFFQVLREFHKITAIIWLVLLGYSLRSVSPKLHLATLRMMLRWDRRDLEWFRFSLENFFTGQNETPDHRILLTRRKFNALLANFYIVGLSLTGLVMWIQKSALVAWYIHAIFFFMSISMVCSHGYFRFVKARGKVAAGGYMKAEMIALCLTLIAGIFGAVISSEGRDASLSKNYANFIRPNELSSKHQIKEIGNDCTKCHEYTGEIKNEKCLHCHKIIQQRMAGKIGFHGKFDAYCRKCHVEHPTISGSIIPFDEQQFNHDLAQFKLLGKHRQVKCQDCHKRKVKEEGGIYYLGTRFANCLDCHKDPHFEHEFGNLCTSCHTENGWTGNELNFVHNRDSKYRHEGKHGKVECRKCHIPAIKDAPLGTARFRGLKTECLACHKDPHYKNEFGRECLGCHSHEGWTGKELRFDHNRDSKYRLDGKHAKTECRKCHIPAIKDAPLGTAQFRGVKSECLACHKDPHYKNELSKECHSCHNAETWTGNHVNFVHNRDSKYGLEGKHIKTECKKCHIPVKADAPLATAQFCGLKKDCLGCHKDPHYKNELGKKCQSCHNAETWIGKHVNFIHNRDSKYSLDGKHLKTECKKCHVPMQKDAPLGSARFRGLKTGCPDCHKEPHRTEYGFLCISCHHTVAWPKKVSDPGFVHAAGQPQVLYGRHATAKCLVCHNKFLIDRIGMDRQRNFANSCFVCHADPHSNSLGLDCGKCHSQKEWKGDDLLFDHSRHSYYVLDQRHRNVKCEKCHRDKRYKPMESKCTSAWCHPRQGGTSGS